MKHDCDMVKDLIPMYRDSICSQDSRTVVEEHFEECSECLSYYENMCQPNYIQTGYVDTNMEEQKAKSITDVLKQMKKKKNTAFVISLIIVIVMWQVVIPFGVLAFLAIGAENQPIVVNTDVSQYKRYMTGEEADYDYQSKWGMDETIFPANITNDMNVRDFKMVYYNPWDAQYLGYLTVIYDDEAYKNEVKRLKAYDSTEYLGYYGVTGFDEGYTLLAMYADDYQGFVYALTDNDNTIIYVEIIFCNYYMDLAYEEYMPAEYFPTGFNAKMNNPYMKEAERKRMEESKWKDPITYWLWKLGGE